MTDQQKPATDLADEVLEAVWTCREDGQDSVEAVLGTTHGEADQGTLDGLVTEGLLRQDRGHIALSDEGERRAAQVIRRHRLAERLLVSALGVSPEQTEALACAFEHSAMPQLTDSICTLLGHPRECPHGKPIPPGPDCEVCSDQRPEVLVRLTEVAAGREARVSHLSTRDHDRLHQLLSMGIAPGASVRVHQRTPVFVVQVAQSELAMDSNVARDIHVWVPRDE